MARTVQSTTTRSSQVPLHTRSSLALHPPLDSRLLRHHLRANGLPLRPNLPQATRTTGSTRSSPLHHRRTPLRLPLGHRHGLLLGSALQRRLPSHEHLRPRAVGVDTGFDPGVLCFDYPERFRWLVGMRWEAGYMRRVGGKSREFPLVVSSPSPTSFLDTSHSTRCPYFRPPRRSHGRLGRACRASLLSAPADHFPPLPLRPLLVHLLPSNP
ncbi:hypothetical protein BCR35DRAFT_130088 [Leucosporidium creatinivorum]|uniref:Uncharacterized protein n=1 Tax=Leucosporidium creatinivorum TaxID=106004 RepID=A0A1Y2EW03_9BASI|nr:hypothetical protein BCR35DRAFT_130088 [Leucosporidium creatinivorum]